ncbi:hypothetical protein [Streptomyces anulatus]|uniref:hypothetical protein n=1 Tax=Streptomyces anulatus TaxID=1892 RepID=UPI002F91AB74|nr:hypothetical protein OG238_42060 [Streptomyces anulatus]
MNTTTAHRLGRPDVMRRYPVIVGEATIIGYVSRWHRTWDAESSVGTHRVGRPPKGQAGDAWAAKWLVQEYAEGRIEPIAARSAELHAVYGPAPLLDPRLPDTPTNRTRALEVWALLGTFAWTPRGGYPGSDNLMLLQCDLCGQVVARFWSKLRGRNGNPPSPGARHTGCLDAAEVRRRVPAYGPAS